jgi:AcrR family transcriptional regulator
MKAESAGAARLYDNSHRAAQAAQTREMILDALVRVMARGVADLSMPAVARESGVSLRTVYRHFPTKRDLLAALNVHLDARMGYSLEPPPRDLDELAANIRHYFWALDGMDDTIRAARASAIWGEARDAAGVPGKLQAIVALLEPAMRTMQPGDRVKLVNTVATLFSQYSLQRMKDDLGISADEAAESVVWAIQTLVRGAAGSGSADDRAPKDLAGDGGVC